MTNQLPEGTYVELKDGCDEVYVLAWAGSRGTITAHDTDEHGFDRVYIEWDKDHWRYNGELDGWTFASHFEPVDPVDTAPKELPKGPDLMEAPEDPEAMMMGAPPVWEGEHMETYIDSMMHSFDRAAESDGFVLITMKRGENEEMGPTITYEISRGSALPDLSDIPGSMILSFIGEQMRYRGQ